MLEPHRDRLEQRVSTLHVRATASSPLTGEISDQIQARVTRRGDLSQGAGVDLAHTQLLGLLNLLLVRHGHEPLLERDRERDERVSRVVLVDPSLDLGEPLVLLPHKVALRQVDEVGDRLGRQQGERVDHLDLSRVVSA
jgi:hypothetical protein